MPNPTKNNHFFEAVQNKIWALHPAKLEEIAVFIDKRLKGDLTDIPEAAIKKGGNKGGDNYEIQDGVAVLPIYGTLSKRMNLLGSISGGSSTEIMMRDFRMALEDSRVDSILLDIDSPGGSVDGTKELADLIFASRDQKPIVAYANGTMASAAYWIGSAAHKIVTPETAMVGSIGVAMMHYDYSTRDEKEGIKRTVITGGAFKRIASDEKPLSKEGSEYLQSMVDDMYGLFLEAVAQNRGTDSETVHKKMADGRLFIGAKALKAGLVDQIGNFDSALALSQQIGGSSMDLKELTAKHPELVKQIQDDVIATTPTYDDGQKEGIKTERLRVIDILAAEADPVEMAKAIKDGTASADAYKQFFLAEKTNKATKLENLEKDATASQGHEDKEPGGKGYMVQVDEYKAANKCSLSDAMLAISKSDPKARTAYIAQQNK